MESVNPNLIHTLVPSIVLGVFAVSFYMLWLHHRSFESARVFAASYFSGCIGFALEASYSMVTVHPLVPFIGDLSYSICATLFAVAVYLRFNTPIPWRTIAAVFAVGVLSYGWFRFGDPNIVARMQILTIHSALLVGFSFPVFWAQRSSLPAKLNIGVISVLALMMAISAVFAVDQSNQLQQDYAVQGSTFMALVNVSVSVLSMVAAVVMFASYVGELMANLRLQGETCSLTGLLNRRGFEARAMALLNENNGGPFAMIVGDIDHFKLVNDTYGHGAGDILLGHFARVIREGVRQSDICGRIGGEEFCVILPGATGSVGRLCAENIRTVFASTSSNTAAGAGKVTASFGVCEVKAGDSYQTLFLRADAALYAAKEQGRDCVVLAGNQMRSKLRVAG